MPPKTRGGRRQVKARQEVEETEATRKKAVPQASKPAKNTDRRPAEAPDKRSKARAASKASKPEPAAELGNQKPVGEGRGGNKAKRKEKEAGTERVMSTAAGRKRRGAAAAEVEAELAVEQAEEEEEKRVPLAKRRKRGGREEAVEETDRAVIAKVATISDTVHRTKLNKKAVTIKQPSALRDGGAPAIKHKSHSTLAGEVMVVGQGDMGQLGLGEDMVEKKKPFPVGGTLQGLAVVEVVCGGMHSVALTREGRVYTWGCNDEGALGRALGDDGDEFLPQEVARLSGLKVVQVAAGDSHTAALTSTGSLYCWGVFRDCNGAFGLVHPSPSFSPELIYSTPYNRPVKIASGSDHVVFITEHGDVYTFGCAEQGQLGRVPECFSSRGGRKGVSLILQPDVVRYRLKKGVLKPKFSDIFCGPYHTFAVTLEGVIFAWGLNNYGQLGAGDLQNRYQPEQLQKHWTKGEGGGLCSNEIFSIAGGQHHSVFAVGGKVYVCGRREYGRLGLGPESKEPNVPTEIPGVWGVTRVGVGGSCSFAVTESGQLLSWGMGTNLQLGTGTEEDVWNPTAVVGKKLENRLVASVSSGGQHTAILVRSDHE